MFQRRGPLCSITTCMPLSSDSRAWKLRVWFVGLISKATAPGWLVIDGLDRAPLTDAARRLIIEIVEAAKNNEGGDLRVASWLLENRARLAALRLQQQAPPEDLASRNDVGYDPVDG